MEYRMQTRQIEEGGWRSWISDADEKMKVVVNVISSAHALTLVSHSNIKHLYIQLMIENRGSTIAARILMSEFSIHPAF